MPWQYPQPTSVMATLIVAIADMLNSRNIKFHLRHSGELSDQGELFKDILHRVILPAQFESATPSK